MEEVDITKSINHVFNILEKQLQDNKNENKKKAIKMAKQAVLEITFRSYTDTSEVTKALLPKSSLFL